MAGRCDKDGGPFVPLEPGVMYGSRPLRTTIINNQIRYPKVWHRSGTRGRSRPISAAGLDMGVSSWVIAPPSGS